MCNLDMADTLATSALSLITQLPKDAELVIVDGGSTDGSVEIAENLSDEFDSVRLVKSPYKTLGEDRNYGTRIADGDIVIHQFDCDDMLYEDSVERIIERIERIETDSWFLISGTFNIAPKEVFKSTGYGETSRAEDKELWRRIESSSDIDFYQEYNDYAKTLVQDSKLDKVRKDILETRGHVRNGVSILDLLKDRVFSKEFSLSSKPFRITNVVYQLLLWKTKPFIESLAQWRRARKYKRQQKYGLPSNLDPMHVREEKKSQTDAHIARDMEAML